MSSTGFDSPRMPSTSTRFEIRRSSFTGPATYERPSNFVARRRTPSPGPSRRPYDSYVPPRSASSSSYRDDYPNVYRENNYRPDYSANNYYSRSPSPNRYLPPRSAEPEVWDRPTSWQDRKTTAAPPSPATSSRSRGHRDDVLATRMFEPSEAWKQTHVDRPLRIDTASSSSDRFADRISPDGPSRRSPVFIPGGDRYRPGLPKRDLYSSSRSEYDSYRPSRRGRTPGRSPSPVSDRRRRDSASSNYARYDHYEPAYGGYTPSGYRSRSPNASSRSVSPRSRSDRGRDGYKTKRKMSRQSSRSSIASSRASEPDTEPVPAIKHVEQDSLTNSKVVATAPSFSSANTLLNGKTPTSQDSKPSTSAQTTGSTAQDDERDGPTVISLNGDPEAKHPVPSTPTPHPVNAVNGDQDRSAPVQKHMPTTTLKHDLLPSPTPTATPMSISSSATPAPTPFIHVPLLSAQEILKPEKRPSPPKSVQVNGSGTSTMSPSSLSTTPLTSKPANDLPSSDNTLDNKLPLKVDTMTVSSTVVSPPSSAPAALTETADVIMTSSLSPSITKSDLAVKPDTNNLPTELPTFADAKSITEALRVVVVTRLLCDRQRREDRVDPILLQNQLISPESCVRADATSPAALVEEVCSGERLEKRRQTFIAAKPSLVEHLEKHHELIANKIQQLKEEYALLHEKWKAHCAALNEQSRTNLASEIETIQHSGRTTRRSTAMTDAVRSDLEMEQIIASLGNDDATDPNHLSVRNLAKIPDMVSVTHGKVSYVFDDTNHAVENPKEYYGPHTGVHDWTDEEKVIFIDKFAAFPKQFGIIADYLPNKTSAQCVDYYYLHKKRLIDFRKVVSQFAPNKRRRGGTRKKKGNGLLADIAQHDAEVHQRDATIPARATRGRKTMAPPESRKSVYARRAAVQFEDTPTSTPTPEPEATRGRRRKSGPNPAPSAPATPSTPFSAQLPYAPAQPLSEVASASGLSVVSATVDEDEITEEERRPTKKAKRPRKTVKSAAIVNDEPGSPCFESVFASAEASDPTSGTKRSGGIIIHWDEEDKNTFLTLLAQYGDDFKRIAASMPNKTSIQVRNYYKFNGPALELEKVAARAPKRSPTPETRDGWKELPFPGSGVLTPKPAFAPPIIDTAPPMASLTQESPALTSALQSSSSQQQDATRHPGTDATSKPSLTWMNGISSRHQVIAPARPADTPGMSPSHIRHYPTATYDTPPINARPGSIGYPTPSVYSSYTQHGLPYHKYYSMPPRPPIPTSAPMHRSLLEVRAGVTRQAGATSPTANRGENPYSTYSVTAAATTPEGAAVRRPYYYPP